MFFRRAKPHVDSFQEKVDKLKAMGFAAQSEGGKTRVSRNGIAALLADADNQVVVDKVGLISGQEIGLLVNGGYQQYWLTPSGRRIPAVAEQLKELHAFMEDLKEGLGLLSLYNNSLGTISSLHLYDRVEERDDAAHQNRPWEKLVKPGGVVKT